MFKFIVEVIGVESLSVFKKHIKSERFNRIFALSASLLLLLLFITTLIPIYQKVEHAEATAGTATASTLTFSSDNSVASVNLSVNSPTGTFATSNENEKAKFSINTNNYTGYTLILKSSGTNTNLTGASTNIATIPATTTYETFSSDGASGQLLNNKWGYIPSYYNSSTNTTNYYPSPTSSDVATINITNSANSSDDTYTIGLGLRADYTNPSGTYANDTFIVEFVANAVVYSISFDDNTGDESVSDIPSVAISGSTTTTGVTLPDTVPTRTGYTFKAWCLGTVSDNGTTCTGTEFDAGATFGLDQTISNANITLYATWTLDCIALPAGTGIMQTYTIASEVLDTVCEGSSTTLTDRRDGSTYTVTKIQGTLWMTQNLRITGTVSSTDSNFITNSSVNVCEDDLTSGNSYTKPMCHDSGNTTNGVWYNYAAATAKTSIGDSNTATATEDICPAGWRLPSYDTNNSAGSVNSLVTTSAASIGYFSPVSGGYYGDGTISNASYGLWWSNAVNDTINRYYLYSGGSSLNVNVNDGRRYDGFYIRCVLDTRTIADVTYMQEITPIIARNTTEGATATLTDRRDNNTYTVAKIEDAIWMTQNLRITGTVSATDSNFSTNTSVNVCEGDLTSGNDYDEPRCHNSGNTTNGVWYNYAAASAKTITGDSNSATATEDICPAGWRLPDYNTDELAGTINSLVTTTETSMVKFSPARGGYYMNGALNNDTNYGFWWSANAYSATNRYLLGVYTNLYIAYNYSYRYHGYYVRCVLETRTTPDLTYMQDVTPTIARNTPNNTTATLTDRRDNNTYSVAKLQNALWMTQNLRITGTVSSTDSNFHTNGSINVCEGDLTSGNSYTEPRCHNSGNTTNGVWYNYAAATAGTITGSSNSSPATEDICPAGWHLPPYNTTKLVGSMNSLLDLPVLSNFLPVTGGDYNGGNLNNADSGYWWSSTAYNATSRYYLKYNSSSLDINGYNRYNGSYIRCVLDTRTIADVTYMQDVTPTIANRTADGATAVLTDRRDSKTYSVAKLKGALWMTQNLRITGTVSATDSNFNTNSSINVCTGDLTSGNDFTEPRCHDSGNNTNGVWYNYAAATAGTITGSSNSSPATEDICPAGWRLPNYDTNSPVGSVNSISSNDATFISLFSPATGGYYYGGASNNASNGYWWSTTSFSGTSRYGLYYANSLLNVSTNDSRASGRNIRCILEPVTTIRGITYMQEITPEIVNNTATGTTAILIDNRDNKSYTVAKLADGNVWMTQNLDHDIVTTTNFYNYYNTDIGHGSTPNTSATWTASTATTTSTTWDTSTSANSAPQSYDPGNLCWDGTINTNGDGTLSNETITCGNDKHMYIGNYYNWPAAIATNDASSYTANNTDANQSICPAGWRLPIGGTANTGSKSFQYLWDQYSDSFDGNTVMNLPLYFTYNGRWYGYSQGTGSDSIYWSSVTYSAYGAYDLNLDASNGAGPQFTISRYVGSSVRCVAR